MVEKLLNRTNCRCARLMITIAYVFYFFGLAAFLKDKGPWIVKPVASSRGRGVFLVNHVSMKKNPKNVLLKVCN